MVTYLDSFVQLCCGEGETLPANTPGGCGERTQCPGHTGLPPLTVGVLPRSTLLRLQLALQGNCLMRAGVACTSQVYAAQAPACSAGELSKAPGVVCSSQAYGAQVQVLGCCTKAQTQLGLRFVSFPGLAAQGTRCLARSLSPGGGTSCPSPTPATGFRVHSGSAVSGVPWVSSGSWSLWPS